MPHLSDAELIQRAKRRDKEAYKELFERYSGKILSYLYRYIGDYQKAEDITIETFLDVYNRLPSYREEGKFLSWVYKIAINFAKKEFRKKSRKEILLDEPPDEEGRDIIGDLAVDDKLRPDYQAAENELEECIEKTIHALDEKYKNVLLLCDIQGLSYEEAASILKCKAMTVGAQLSRARQLLYEALKRQGYSL
jgi:RNA polymerase sigma-70 factor (ECF subfamily)